MAQGVIMKALSGFYYVDLDGRTVTCRGRGKLRHEKVRPLVGDRVEITPDVDGTGTVDAVLPRRNCFARPAVANVDQLVILAANVNPVTDPFLIDRLTAMAAGKGCEVVVCLNKCDLDKAGDLYGIYAAAGYPTLRLSAQTGEGVEELRALLKGKTSAFTGNSGVGKSSLLNALEPQYALETGQVSDKLGRGRHTTRHVELFRACGGLVADTPGFSSLEGEALELPEKERLAACFAEFAPYLDGCRFQDCSHRKEAGCGLLVAVERGEVAASRHKSYCRLCEELDSVKPWEHK